MKRIFACIFYVFVNVCIFAQTDDENVDTKILDNDYTNPVILGLYSYADDDWLSAVYYFKQAISQKETTCENAWFWLVMSDVACAENSLESYNNVVLDADFYLSEYSYESRSSDVLYMKALALFNLSKYEESVRTFESFIEKYPDHQLKPSALFWIAESQFALRDLESAALIYVKIINTYPNSSKKELSCFRIDSIKQQIREDELLELLKVTHEEALRANEEYDRRSKIYEQSIDSYQNRISELMKDSRLEDVEVLLNQEKEKTNNLSARIVELESELDYLKNQKNENNVIPLKNDENIEIEESKEIEEVPEEKKDEKNDAMKELSEKADNLRRLTENLQTEE